MFQQAEGSDATTRFRAYSALGRSLVAGFLSMGR